MLDGQRLAVVVPAYNEARLIGTTLRSIPDFVDDILVVNDGSTDATTEAIRRVDDRRVHLLIHEHNAGVGAAIATGYTHALSRGAHVIAVMAADGQMDPENLKALCRPVLFREADYAKGDRLSWPGAWRTIPWSRFVGGHVFSWATSVAIGVPIRDSQCGYTAVSARAARELLRAGIWSRYGYPNDILGTCARKDLRIEHVCVRPIYGTERSDLSLQDALWSIPLLLTRIFALRFKTANL